MSPSTAYGAEAALSKKSAMASSPTNANSFDEDLKGKPKADDRRL
jgi:hypothetical protein